MTRLSPPTNRGWLRKWLRGEPHIAIGNDPDDPYLLRWYVIPRNPVLNVYLHKFLRSDDDRALHDHPWWFLSLILKGGYTEVTEDARTPRSGILGGRYRGWDRQFAFRPATFRHRVELWPEQVGVLPCWTLIVTGRVVRKWGFWCKTIIDPWSAVNGHIDRFVPFDEWDTNAGCGEA